MIDYFYESIYTPRIIGRCGFSYNRIARNISPVYAPKLWIASVSEDLRSVYRISPSIRIPSVYVPPPPFSNYFKIPVLMIILIVAVAPSLVPRRRYRSVVFKTPNSSLRRISYLRHRKITCRIIIVFLSQTHCGLSTPGTPL